MEFKPVRDTYYFRFSAIWSENSNNIKPGRLVKEVFPRQILLGHPGNLGLLFKSNCCGRAAKRCRLPGFYFGKYQSLALSGDDIDFA